MGKRNLIPVALDYLRSTESALRTDALVYLLKKINSGDTRVVTALVRALDDPDDGLRGTVAMLLGQIGARGDLLLAHLQNDPSPTVRYWCLRNFWPGDTRALEAYAAALEDSDDRVLIEACIKVGLMRRQICTPFKDEVVPALRRLLEHPTWRVRFQACEAFYKIGAVEERIVTTLEELRGQPAAVEYDDGRHWSRRQSRDKREHPPWLFTTDELLHAAREALIRQRNAQSGLSSR